MPPYGFDRRARMAKHCCYLFLEVLGRVAGDILWICKQIDSLPLPRRCSILLLVIQVLWNCWCLW